MNGMVQQEWHPRDVLVRSFTEAVAAADPLQIMARHLPIPAKGKTLVVGAGKAAASMALALERAYADYPVAIEGVVITRYAHGLPTQWIRVVEAGHPVPDEAGEVAAREILRIASALEPDDRLIVLVSGGGSSLLSLPVAAVTMADLKAVTHELLRCGAPIAEMNVVRKHLSQLQGGRLAAIGGQQGAEILALIVSDVTGDDPSTIASGPCAPDPSCYADALAVLRRYGAKVPDKVWAYLEAGVRGDVEETPKPGDACFTRVSNLVIAKPRQSLEAAAAYFRSLGITPLILGDTVTGEAREVAKVYAALVREVRGYGQPVAAPVALISGGECTVTMAAAEAAQGRGGRCSEFLLSLALELNGMPGVYALAADTDGIDGSEDNAGALLFPDTLRRAEQKGIQVRQCLDKHDAWGFFEAIGDLLVTGPTRTNVNDYRVILVG